MEHNNIHGVVLGLDVGDVRVGVARAHTFARLPEPLEIIDRTKSDAVARIKLLAAEEGATLLVIGMPAYKSGKEGPQAAAVREFAKAVQAAVPLPQQFVDESFTSVEADTFMINDRVDSSTGNDAVAACLILQRYFDEVVNV